MNENKDQSAATKYLRELVVKAVENADEKLIRELYFFIYGK